jgi:hypothetical protein
MFLTISGKPSKVSTKTVKAAMGFYADYLMKNHNKVDVYLDFEKGYLKGQGNQADCCNDDGKQFTITVDADMGERAVLMALAHEMVHVKQYCQDKFGFNSRKRMYRFGGEYYPEDMNYWDCPWEIEAFGRELGLYTMFKQSQKKAK